MRLQKSTKLAVRPGDIDAEMHHRLHHILKFVIYGVKTACATTTSITTDSKTSTGGFIYDLLCVKDDDMCVCGTVGDIDLKHLNTALLSMTRGYKIRKPSHPKN